MSGSFRPLRTAEDMYDYCKTYDMGIGSFKFWSVKHFRLIEEELKPTESVFTAFVVLLIGFNYSFAITNDRILMSKQALVGSFVKSISLLNINDITLRKDFIHGFIEIDTTKERVSVVVVKKCADNIHECIHKSLDMAKQFSASKLSESQTLAYSEADELMKFKKLLDDGIITSEEFESKKRQLLGL